MRSGWLEVVRSLYAAHEADVAWEHDECEGGEGRRREETEAVEAQQPEYEVELVA